MKRLNSLCKIYGNRLYSEREDASAQAATVGRFVLTIAGDDTLAVEYNILTVNIDQAATLTKIQQATTVAECVNILESAALAAHAVGRQSTAAPARKDIYG